MSTNYRDMPHKIANLEGFTGNSAHARALTINNQPAYVVWSYQTPMLLVNGLGQAYLNIDKHGQATSRLQSMLRGLFPDAKHVALAGARNFAPSRLAL